MLLRMIFRFSFCLALCSFVLRVPSELVSHQIENNSVYSYSTTVCHGLSNIIEAQTEECEEFNLNHLLLAILSLDLSIDSPDKQNIAKPYVHSEGDSIHLVQSNRGPPVPVSLI